MDLAESILNELVTLQKKNEELVGIIRRLEHESDVIIHQFEEKIADLNKTIKKAQDSCSKSEKKYELLVRESKKEQEGLIKEKQAIESDLSEKISCLEEQIHQISILVDEKETKIHELTEESNKKQLLIAEEAEEYQKKIITLQTDLEKECSLARSEYDRVTTEYKERISLLQDEVSTKESELRALAGELKHRLSSEQKARQEREREKRKNDKLLSDLKESLESEKNMRKTLQSDFAEESVRFSKIIQDLQNKISDLERRNERTTTEMQSGMEALQTENRILLEKNAENKTLIADYLTEIEDLRDRLSHFNQELTRKDDTISTLTLERDSLRDEMETRISHLNADNDQKNLEISSLNETILGLEGDLSSLVQRTGDRIQTLEKALEDTRRNESLIKSESDARISALMEKNSELNNRVSDLDQELRDAIRLKEQREEEYRNEITHLHEEMIHRSEDWKEKLELKSRELTEKDRHISMISGNNEALRSELERVRSRLLLLEKTIREDKEEPVHALYRQIQNLSANLAGKESENAVLASRIIRLDTENTRLTQLLAGSKQSFQEPDLLNGRVYNGSDKQGGKPASPLKDISSYLSNLDDPMQAMDAAAAIIRSGPGVTDTLIPLLYRGPLHRRAWIAVLLYEMNDPKAIPPLSDLLDSSESGLRELIWDTRLRFREWRRSHMASSEVR